MQKYFLTILFNTLLFSLNTFSQMKEYTTEWKKVETALKKGLTTTANNETKSIFQLALKEDNSPQIIKAAMHLIGFRSQLIEESELSNHFFLDTLIAQTKAPAKNIIQSMQAELLYQYLQQNRWKFYNRTEQKEEIATDIQTWSLGKLNKTISEKYEQSLQQINILQKTPSAAFKAIIIEGKNTEKLRPSIYDILAFRALAYYSSDEQSIAQPSYKFNIEQEQAFSADKDFVKFVFKTKDTASVHFKAIKFYQDILTFHLPDKEPNARIDADILRMVFVKNYSTHMDKSDLYIKALQQIVDRFSTNPATAQAGYLIAQEYINTYKAGSKTDGYYKKAKAICEMLLSKFPKSEGGINASNLLREINKKDLQFNVELVNVPNSPFRTSIQYRNLEKVYFRIIKTDKVALQNLEKTDYYQQWKAFVNLTPFRSFSFTLPNPKDLQLHRTEAKIEKLDIGMYILLASAEPDFKTSDNVLVRDVFHVSNLSIISSANEYHVLHRFTGQPFENASVQTWEHYYDYDKRVYVDQPGKKYSTDKNGFFKTTVNKDQNRQIKFEISHKQDRLFLLNNFYNYYENEGGELIPTKDRAFLFTDRSIYRPGQTLYFKGIVIHEKKEPYSANVVANKKVKVQLLDANYQKVQTLDLITNEFGSYNGAFTIPNNGLTGQFHINDSTNGSSQYFNVEEYKRPKFTVEIKQPKGSYRLWDSVKITGTAKAYAGNNIDGAKVKYRVVRKVQYPVWWDGGFYYRGGRSRYNPYNRGEEMEITNGETETNAKGEFTISFKAIPDENVEKESQPVFNYEINADITDINGETRTGNTIIPVSYQALQINIGSIDKLPADSFKAISITSNNINGQFEPATVQVTIHNLNAPKTFLRTRYWEAPDQFILNEADYKAVFPFDIYHNEDQKASWKKTKTVLSQNYTTSENKKLELGTLKLTAGFYQIEVIGKDKFGETVKAIHFMELTDENILQPFSGAISIQSDKTTLQPNDVLNYKVTTAMDNIFAIHEQNFIVAKKLLGKDNKILQNSKQWRFYEQYNKGSKNYSLNVLETDRGGLNSTVSFVKYNQVFGSDLQFYVPWTNKELKIEFETFRDKTLPGSEEQYTVKISGRKGDKFAAEMLATMYDASLDQLKPHALQSFNLYPNFYGGTVWNGNHNFTKVEGNIGNLYTFPYVNYIKTYPVIGLKTDKTQQPLWWLNPLDYVYNENYKFGVDRAVSAEPMLYDMAPPSPAAAEERKADGRGDIQALLKKVPGIQTEVTVNTPEKKENGTVQIRKNFKETAFFLPDLRTDAEGNVRIKFTIPEALTEWKLMAIAHTKDMMTGKSTKKVVTQKPLMVQPNLPRFLREGDKLELSVKVVNLTDKEITGTSLLELIDATTNQSVDGWFKNIYANQYFTVPAGQSVPVIFSTEIPFNYLKPLIIRVTATAKDIAGDGEENIIPVVTNRMLVTETMPLPMRGVGTRMFKMDKLIAADKSTSIAHQGITLEYTSNPAWYAVQALPYLIEYPYECAEQTFNRYYANALASKVANSNPKIKAVFDQWASADSKELISNLSKNEELKSALITETPWVMDATNETQQKKNIALLFDLNKMSKELKTSIKKLREMQSSNGGFVWFKGGRDDRYITQYILTGIGHLKKLGALDLNPEMEAIIQLALPYLDARIKEDYDYIHRYKLKLENNNTGDFQIHYLYMRSFFPERKIPANCEQAYQYFLGQTSKFWLPKSKYMQGMSALVLQRNNKKETAMAIIKSLKENAIVNEELGMYWKDVTGGYYWHQAPIETMSLMIEAFSEIGNEIKAVDDLRTWLLKNKQTNNWRTTKATAEACYAFLLQGTDFLQNTPVVSVQIGDTDSFVFGDQQEGEAGTLYSKKRITGEKVKPAMGNIKVTVTNPKNIAAAKIATSWGGFYWQYFEDLDKITSAETPLKLKKKIFKESLTEKGKQLIAINENDLMKVGDKMIIRIELKVDRDMEYIHMKDMRSSGTEPINVLSQYKWQDGLGYYESTKDASTNFFFNYLPKGTYVFEYPLFVTHKGNFSNGVTTIQCMYAPEFSSHSEGVRVKVD